MAAGRVQTSITLFGAPPWGFRLSGGKEYSQPLVITRLTPGSLAARSGVHSGDVLIAINGEFVGNLSQDECEAKVRQASGSLHLVLEKNAAKVTEHPGGQVTVEGDRSVYNSCDDTKQRVAQFNRAAKPFNSFQSNTQENSTREVTKVEAPKPSSTFKSVGFQPKAASTPSPTQSPTPKNLPVVNSSTAQARHHIASAIPPFALNGNGRKNSPKPAGTSHNRTAKNYQPPPPAAKPVYSPVYNPDNNPLFDPTALKRSAKFQQGSTVMQGPGKSKVVHAQYNTPMGMYSNDNIIDTVQAQAKSLGVAIPGAEDDAARPQFDVNSPVFRAVHSQNQKPPSGSTQSRSFKMLQATVQPNA